MVDFDQLVELLNNVLDTGADDLTLGGLSLEQLADALAEAGIDVSQLSEADIASLISVEESTTIEHPDGTTEENTQTMQLGSIGGLGMLAAGGAGYSLKGKSSEEEATKKAHE